MGAVAAVVGSFFAEGGAAAVAGEAVAGEAIAGATVADAVAAGGIVDATAAGYGALSAEGAATLGGGASVAGGAAVGAGAAAGGTGSGIVKALGGAATSGVGTAVGSLLSPNAKMPTLNIPGSGPTNPSQKIAPMPDPTQQQEAIKRSMVEQFARRGRAASILTQSGGKLGG
jgi:hypothetical protein